MKTWFDLKQPAQDGAPVEISIYDEIGAWGVTAVDFLGALKAHAGKPVVVNINSPGGSLFDALAMYNGLRQHGAEITTRTMGVAASAASVVFMAGDKRVMPENTFLLIHNVLAPLYGNADEHREFADLLDKINQSIVSTYVARTGKCEKDIKAALDQESYLSAEEAVAQGFADEVEPALRVSASFDIERLPESVRAVFQASAIKDDTGDAAFGPPVVDDTLAGAIAEYAATVGMGEYAAHIALNPLAKTLEDAKALIGAAREIHALCVLTKKQELAAALIAKGATVADAREELCTLLAEADEKTHTASHGAASAQASAKKPAAGSTWAKIFPTIAAQHKE